MSLGYPTTKNDIDSRVGGLAVDMRNIFQAAQALKFMVDALLDADLAAMGYTPTDTARLRSGAADFDHLAEVYLGTSGGVQAAPLDFRRFTKFWLGTA